MNTKKKHGSLVALGFVTAAVLGLFALFLAFAGSGPAAAPDSPRGEVSARVGTPRFSAGGARVQVGTERTPSPTPTRVAPPRAELPLAMGLDPTNPAVEIAVVALAREDLGPTATFTLSLRVKNTGTQAAVFAPRALHLGVRHASDPRFIGQVYPSEAQGGSDISAEGASLMPRQRRGVIVAPSADAGVPLRPGEEIAMPLIFRVPVEVQQVDLVLGLGSPVWTFLEL